MEGHSLSERGALKLDREWCQAAHCQAGIWARSPHGCPRPAPSLALLPQGSLNPKAGGSPWLALQQKHPRAHWVPDCRKDGEDGRASSPPPRPAILRSPFGHTCPSLRLTGSGVLDTAPSPGLEMATHTGSLKGLRVLRLPEVSRFVSGLMWSTMMTCGLGCGKVVRPGLRCPSGQGALALSPTTGGPFYL